MEPFDVALVVRFPWLGVVPVGLVVPMVVPIVVPEQTRKRKQTHKSRTYMYIHIYTKTNKQTKEHDEQ